MRPDDHRSFASLEAVLAQLEVACTPAQRRSIEELRALLVETSPATAESQSQLMSDSVAFAILRRISRESVYTARAIDRAAKVLNSVLAARDGLAVACVEPIERIDRLSLKVFLRAMLLLRPEDGLTWVWRCGCALDDDAGDEDPFVASRRAFLRQLIGIARPRLVANGAPEPLRRPPSKGAGVDVQGISSALVLQNYDACFLWSDRLLASPDPELRSEGQRLHGLALVNVGRHEGALNAWSAGLEATGDPTRRAHFRYLQGLVETKRQYDLDASDRRFRAGLSELARGAYSDGDLLLEKAWLLNGLALNEAIRWRRRPTEHARFRSAFDHLQRSFALVREGKSPARFYLRFNLLANVAFLLEIQGSFERAVQVLESTFDEGLLKRANPTVRHRMRSNIAYRIGVLHYRGGHLDRAARLLEDAEHDDAQIQLWATRERILRARGVVALEQKDPGRAAELFGRGLDVSLSERAAEGAAEHGRGLTAAWRLASLRSRIGGLEATLAAEGIALFAPPGDRTAARRVPLAPGSPSPKLPPYVPDVDLEGIPAIDLNRYLGGALPRTTAGDLWRS